MLGLDQSETITDKEQIAEEFANYYETLYRNEVNELSNLKLPRILQEKKHVTLTKAITVEEIKQQIHGMKAGHFLEMTDLQTNSIKNIEVK